MQVSDRLDNDVVDNLGHQFSALINKDPEISHGEVLQTAIALINATIELIHCPGCRAASIEFAKENFGSMIEWTLKGSPPTMGGNTPHIH